MMIYIDIPIFIRLRDVFNVWNSLSIYDWTHIDELNFYQLGNSVDRVGERTDTTSSLWRFAQWITILKEYVGEVWSIPFGLGVGKSVKMTGYMPHNDFILILAEYGLVVFVFFIYFVNKMCNVIRSEEKIIYFILAMFLYHLTENLIGNFPSNAILYFSLGWCYYKFRSPVLI